MNRQASAVFAVVLLLLASLLSVGKVVMPATDQIGTFLTVNTDDGVSLEESVLDDLRPGVTLDSQGASPLDLGLRFIWTFATQPLALTDLPSDRLPVEHVAPWLPGLLRPPAQS